MMATAKGNFSTRSWSFCFSQERASQGMAICSGDCLSILLNFGFKGWEICFMGKTTSSAGFDMEKHRKR
jgi:hypothetical protein